MSHFRYDAFISYSTATDYQQARKLEAFLEAFHRTPAPVGATIRKLQICRDGSDFRLPSKKRAAVIDADDDPVWQTILSELRTARYLLVLCSPGAVKSPWVDKEIAWMRNNRGVEWILPIVTEGIDPTGNPTECFPQQIREANLHLTRIWYDLRGVARTAGASKVRDYEDELVRLAGDLIGWSAEKHGPLASVWEREQLRRRRKQAKVALGIAAALIAIASVAIWQAVMARQQARKARASAIVQWADAAFDPCTAALVLSELQGEEEPEGGMQVAQKLASTRLPMAVLRGHTGRITKISFSPDQQSVLTASRDATARIWPANGRGDAVVLSGHTKTIRDACFNADGTLVATASEDHSVRLWRWSAKEAPQEFLHEAEVESVQFTFDSKWLATISGGNARLWRISDRSYQPLILPEGTEAARLWLDPRQVKGWLAAKDGSIWAFALNPGDKVEVTPFGEPSKPSDTAPSPRWEQVAFSVDGSRAIFATGQDVIARKCGGEADRPAAFGHKVRVNSIALNHDGSRVLTAASDGRIRLWNADANAEPEREIDSNRRYWSANLFEKTAEKTDKAPEFRQILFSDSGKHLAALCDDGVIRLWSAQVAEPPIELRGHLGGEVLVFATDEERLATGADDGTARVWSLAPPSHPVVFPHPRQVYAASFSPDGRKVISSCADGIVRLWPLDGAGGTVELNSHREGAPKVAFNRAFNLVACAYNDGVARLWSLDRPDKAPQEFAGNGEALRGVCFSPGETELLTWSEDGALRLWPLDGAESPVVFDAASGSVWKAAFDQTGNILAAYDNGTARVWSAAQPNHFILLGGRNGHTRSVIDAAMSADGKRVLTASSDGTARLWQSNGRNAPRVLIHSKVQDEWLEHCAWSPDGKSFVAASSASRIWIWKTELWGERQIMLRHIGDLAHVGPITKLAFNPDGKRIATGGGVDATVRLWRSDGSLQPVDLFAGGLVTDVGFSPDGKLILGASESGMVKVWRSDWADLLSILRTRTTATLTPEQRISLLGEDEKRARSVYENQEVKFGRVPLSRDWIFQYPF